MSVNVRREDERECLTWLDFRDELRAIMRGERTDNIAATDMIREITEWHDAGRPTIRKRVSMVGYRYRDGGRAEAGYMGKAGDCVARATALLITGGDPNGEDYRKVYCAMAAERANRGLPRSAHNGVFNGLYRAVFNDLYRAVFNDLGVVRQLPGKRQWLTWTEAYNRFGNCIVSTSGHFAAIIDGVVLDTHDEREYKWGEPDSGYRRSTEWRERKAASIYTLAKGVS